MTAWIPEDALGGDAKRVVRNNVVNLYASPDTASGMVSQAVMNDRLLVTEEVDNFCHVTTHDCYAGWIEQHLLVPLSPYLETPDTPTAVVQMLFADVFPSPDPRAGIVTKLVAGTRVTLPRDSQAGDWIKMTDPDGYIHRSALTEAIPDKSFQQTLSSDIPRLTLIAALGYNVTETAKQFFGTPYLWGGCTPFGIDCSGLTQLVYKLNGIQLLRDAHLQFGDRRFVKVDEGLGLDVALLEDGDLVAFSRRDDGQPTHIGIALGDGRFLHSRGGYGVRTDYCDDSDYTKTYVGAVRLSADADFSIQSA